MAYQVAYILVDWILETSTHVCGGYTLSSPFMLGPCKLKAYLKKTILTYLAKPNKMVERI